jgi:hypothetical protein
MANSIAVHEPAIQREGVAGTSHPDVPGELGHGAHYSSSVRSSEVGSPRATHSFFGHQ